jgi:hypothetical protein
MLDSRYGGNTSGRSVKTSNSISSILAVSGRPDKRAGLSRPDLRAGIARIFDFKKPMGGVGGGIDAHLM